MTTMFPDNPGEFTTSGEKDVFNFLRTAGRPDTFFMAWYSPDIESREPDFILYSPDCGLIVLEVKDWAIQQILEINSKEVCLEIGGKQVWRKQPLAQAKEYVNAIMNLLQKKAQPGKKQLPCPVVGGAVFPHIRREEFYKNGLNKILDEARVLFWDDIRQESPLRKDASGQKFRHWLQEHFPPLFPFSLAQEDMVWLRGCLFPVVRLNLPRRSLSPSQNELVLTLDYTQENYARDLDIGRTLLIGPAGSGKTLILAHHAWYLPRMNKKIKRVLITCFNLALPGYIRRLLAAKGAPLGPGGVEVIPFYALCERILTEKLPHSGEDGDYYELVTREANDNLAGDHPLKGYWDAILVDEGQDFSSEMACVLLRLLPEHGALLVAEDENQVLYKGAGSAWKDLAGIKIEKLNTQYRNTKPIAEFACKILGARQPDLAGAKGKPPVLLVADSPAQLLEAVASGIAALVAQGVPMNEIAVLYTRSHMEHLEKPLPEALCEVLDSMGILSRWAARNTESKRNYDITTDSVTISTIHTVKGLDFGYVFLLGADLADLSNPHYRHLLYVGITRARESLVLGVCDKSSLERYFKH